MLLASFAAAIIGGVLLTGGRGSIFGTLIGAASLGILQVGLTLSGVQVDVQNIVIGLILLHRGHHRSHHASSCARKRTSVLPQQLGGTA